MSSYTLPDLPYDHGALEPAISGSIIELHHGKHHNAYVTGANTVLEQIAEARDAGSYGSIVGLEKTLAFHLSGHALHSIYWTNLSPDGGDRPDGALGDAIDRNFGGFDQFKAHPAIQSLALPEPETEAELGWQLLQLFPLKPAQRQAALALTPAARLRWLAETIDRLAAG